MIYEFFSGSYGKEAEEGIVKFRMDTETGNIEKVFTFRGIENPSYLGFNASKTILYAVQEKVPAGQIHALRVAGDRLVPLASLSTEGADPCHVSLDETGKVLFVDNYTSGSLAVFQVGENGDLERMTQLIVHEGKGAHPIRQGAPHVHYTKEHDGQAFVVDLGLDQIFLYDVDPQSGLLSDTGKRIHLPAGMGPRHIEFHRSLPGILYVICELGNQVAVFQEEGKDYVLKQMIGTLPDDFTGESTAAAVKQQGNLLFASNRGHDSIAVYRILPDGLLERTDIAPTGGRTPRDFTLFGDYMVVANQDSDNITVLQVDWETGRLLQTGMEAETVRPSCIRKY